MDQRLISADSHVRITEDWVRERLPATALESYETAVQDAADHRARTARRDAAEPRGLR